jgi:hypothetical protein
MYSALGMSLTGTAKPASPRIFDGAGRDKKRARKQMQRGAARRKHAPADEKNNQKKIWRRRDSGAVQTGNRLHHARARDLLAAMSAAARAHVQKNNHAQGQ